MTDIVNIGFAVNSSQIEKGYQRFQKMGNEAEKAESKTTSALGSIGRSAGQAGIQIQQFVGQVQMGTSPMVALSQQAADLGIVLGAPLLGAVAGIAASFGTVLLPSLFDADDAADKLKDTLESLDKVTTKTSNGTFTLSNEIARLARVSQTAANAQIALSMTEATQAISLAKDAASEAISEFDDLFNGFDVVATVDTLDNLDETLSRTGKSITELLEETNLASTGLTQLKSFSESLGDSLGVTTEQSVKLIRAVSKFKQDGSVSDLATLVSEMSLSTKSSTTEFKALAVELNKLSLTTESANSVLTLLKETMGDLDSILQESDTSVNDVIQSYKDKTEALHADEVQMAKNIALQAIGSNATESEKNAVLGAVSAYYQKLNAIRAESKAQKKARVEQSKRQKQQKKEAEELFKDLISGTDSVDLFALNQAKAYDKWLESISTTTTKIAELKAEIDKTQRAIESGDLLPQVGAEYIEQINSDIDDLNKTEDPFSNMASGATEYLSAIQMLAEDGSDAYVKLERAIASVGIAQSLMTGNFAGAIASGVGLLMSFDKELKDLSVDIQANQNLDAWGEKADSISVATDITAHATEKLVGINSDMLNALKVVQNGITGASGIISQRNTGASVDIGGLGIIGNVLTNSKLGGFIMEGLDLFNMVTFNLLGGLTNWISKSLGGLLGGKSSVADEGIQIIGGRIADLTDDVLVQAYQLVSYKKSKFSSTKWSRAVKTLSGEVSNQFALVFGSIIDSVASGAEVLGLSQFEIEKAINDFGVNSKVISLKGLSKDRQQKEIEAYFSGVFNNLASSVIPFLDEFQQAGEELGETLSRLATEVSVAEYLVDNLGVTMTDKLADPKAFAQAADNLSTLAGGAEALVDQVSSFVNSFASDSQKFDIYQEALSEALNEVGLRLPATAAGFYDLMASLDGSTEMGQQQIATLLKLTDTADGYFRLLDSSVGKFREAAEGLYDVSFAAESVALDSALAAARLGDFSLADELDLGGLTPSKSDFASLVDYNIARAETASKLNELADLQSGSVSIDEKQLTVLEQIRDNIKSSESGSKEAQSGMMETLNQQMMALKQEMQDVSEQLRYGTLTVTQEA